MSQQEKGSVFGMEGGDGGEESQSTLWCGDLQYWMDESFLSSSFAAVGEVQKVKARILVHGPPHVDACGLSDAARRPGVELIVGALCASGDAQQADWPIGGIWIRAGGAPPREPRCPGG